jgi:hypothetical protein
MVTDASIQEVNIYRFLPYHNTFIKSSAADPDPDPGRQKLPTNIEKS